MDTNEAALHDRSLIEFGWDEKATCDVLGNGLEETREGE